LSCRIDELTKRLTEVELSKTQTEKKAKKFEAEVKTLKKTKGLTPSFEGIQVLPGSTFWYPYALCT
jgi:hypothetical protein